MDFMCVFGCILLFIELSTPFQTFRWLLFKHGMQESKLYAINAMFLFFTFFFGRCVFQVYVVFWYGLGWLVSEYEKKNLTFYKGVVAFEMGVMVLLSIALNSYWMYLMIKMLIRVLKRARQAEADPIEKVELVKADALAEDEEGS